MREDEIVLGSAVGTILLCMFCFISCALREQCIREKKRKEEMKKYIVDIRTIPVASVIIMNPIQNDSLV